MLEDIDPNRFEELFDGSRLEELAESLLADVSTEFEADATKGGHRIAQAEGKPKSMFRSMVGSQTEELESGEDTNGSINTPTHQPTINAIKQEIIDCLPPDDELTYASTALNAPANQMQIDSTHFNHSEQMFDIDNNKNNNNDSSIDTRATISQHICSTNKSMIFRQNGSDIRTSTLITDIEPLYETTYDEDGNIITILPDEDISNFEEVIEEIQPNDEDDEYMAHVSVLSPISAGNYASPGGYSLNSADEAATVSDHDSAYDSSINSPPGKLSSGWSPASSDDYRYYDYWPQDSFSVELFPSLA